MKLGISFSLRRWFSSYRVILNRGDHNRWWVLDGINVGHSFTMATSCPPHHFSGWCVDRNTKNPMFHRSLYILVGGLEHFLFFHILGIIYSPIWLIFFRGVQTTNQYIFLSFSPLRAINSGAELKKILQLQLGMLHTKPLGPASQNKLPLKRSCWPYIRAYLQMGIPGYP